MGSDLIQRAAMNFLSPNPLFCFFMLNLIDLSVLFDSFSETELFIFYFSIAAQVAPVVKNLPASAGDLRDAGSIPGSGRSLGEGNGNPLQ